MADIPRLGGLKWDKVDGQAGPCMGQCMGVGHGSVHGTGAWVGGSDVLGGGLKSLPRKPNLSNFQRALNQCLGEEFPPPPPPSLLHLF